MQAQSPIEAQSQRGMKKYKPWAHNRENMVYVRGEPHSWWIWLQVNVLSRLYTVCMILC